MRILEHILDRFQLFVYTILYILSSILVLGSLIWITRSLPIFIIALLLLFAIILSIVTYSYIYVIFSIPQDLAGSYDKLKNNISNGSIIKPSDFATQLNTFLIEFFSYSFFNIKHSATQLLNDEPICSSEMISNSIDWSALDLQSRHSEALISLGKISVGDDKLFAYVLPVYFEKRYMGYISVFCSEKLGVMHKKFLVDFENHYLDDQLVRLTLTK